MCETINNSTQKLSKLDKKDEKSIHLKKDQKFNSIDLGFLNIKEDVKLSFPK